MVQGRFYKTLIWVILVKNKRNQRDNQEKVLLMLYSCFVCAGTSPHAPTNVHAVASSTWANVSWEAGYSGGFQQTFSVWYGHVWVIPACFASCFLHSQYIFCCFWKYLFQGYVQNSCESIKMEFTWSSSVSEFLSLISKFLEECIQNKSDKSIATKLDITQTSLCWGSCCCCCCCRLTW